MKKEFLSKIAVNKSLLKEYNNDNQRTVYLNDGEEFQIQLFNPHSYNIGAKVYINDEYLGNIIVIRPGQRLWLERYLDSSNKFKFSIYSVENTYESKKAIQHNGNIKIEFYNEIKPRCQFNDIIYVNNDNCNGHILSDSTHYFSKLSSTSDGNSVANYSNYSCSIDNEIYPKSSWVTTSCASIDNDTITASYVDNGAETASYKIDTGRIEKGSYSNQTFKDVNINFCNWAFSTENIKILPMSQKQYNDNDLKKIYCHECGRRIKNKFKFCPYCGAKQ